MPKAFDATEKAAIRAALLRVGFQHFERLGVRQTRVEDICREVGIAKGSFYSFFPSREELFMTIVEAREAEHVADMLAFIGRPRLTPRRRAAGMFDLIMEKLETDPVLNLVLAHGEIQHLVLKLGPERFETGQRLDRAFARRAAKDWREAGGGTISADDLLGLMTIALSVAVSRRQMTPAQYAPTVRLLRELFISRLVGGTQ